MIDYHGLWQGLLLLFALPAAIGLALGVVWAWRKGRRGSNLVAPAILGAGVLSLVSLLAVVLLFGY